MYIPHECSPIGIDNQGSCLSNDLLKKIGLQINSLNICDEINCYDNRNLHNEISDRIKQISNCKKESCWVSIRKITNELSNNDRELFIESFKPFIPKGWFKKPNMWLNTSDINNVLRRYEKKYKDFKYFGALPIDFEKKRKKKCISGELCKLNLKDLISNYKSFGVVFNTDPHNKGGEHWFSMYVDLIGINRDNPTIYYFDSALNPMKKEIKKLVKKIKREYKKLLNDEMDFLFNDEQHQYGNTECGIYSIHFLIEMLKGKNFDDYVDRKLSDKKMEKFRKIFFITPN